MKILLVSSGSGSRGGGEIFLDYLGQGLADRGHEVLVWMPAHQRMDELAAKCARFAVVIRSDYTNTYDLPARSLSTLFNAHVSRRVAREWIRLAPDVVHLNKQNLEDGLDLLRSLSLVALPSVCTIHLTQTARFLRARVPGLRDRISRSALARYPGVLVGVEEVRRKELNEFLAGRVRTRAIFNGVPLPDDSARADVRRDKRKQLGLTEENVLVIGLGRLVDQKRPFLFLETARELHRQLPNVRFLWVGDGALSTQWRDWVRREELEDAISCTGWQTDPLPFLFAADLLLHVAEYEGLPFALLEAMAAGLPCAIARSSAAELSVFGHDEVLQFDDPSDLVDSLRNGAALRRIAVDARRLVETRLSQRAMIDSYERLYREVLGE